MEPSEGRLRTWAEIGAYVGRDARTAQRYERTAGLPVHRLAIAPGSTGSAVYALRSELDAWMQARDCGAPLAAAGETPPVEAPAPARRVAASGWPRAAAVAAFACVLALGAAAGLLTLRSPVHAAQPSPEARALYQQGVYAWSRRTSTGLMQAIDAFTQAVVIDPQYAAAYVGLADCYNLAPEVGGLKPSEAFPRALAAASRAVSLNARSAPAHRALGFVEFWWRQEAQLGLAEMRKAERLEPQSALTHQWLANMLAMGHDESALKEIDQALSIEPSTSAMADKGLVLTSLGLYDDAHRVLREVVQLEPRYAPAHAYLTTLARRDGDEATVLRETRITAELRHDIPAAQAAARAEKVLRAEGRTAALEEVAANQEQLLESGRGDSFQAALAQSDLRRRDTTLARLAQARAERDPALLSLSSNPDFAWLKGDAGFRKLLVTQWAPGATPYRS